MGREGRSSAMMWPARSVTVKPKGSLRTETWSLAVLKPTALALDSGVTLAVAVRDVERTAHEASSGNWPEGPTRTRTTSSRRAVICITAEPERISIPLALGREAVTRSSRTKPGFCWDSAAELACDVAARNKNPNRTGRKLTTLFTQHL